ncbi:hypothetical protein [Nereida sp. MMG025]|uniref:hypothetical protein n=1 Tax=Nereida sp. MMG025 TaxID=2909981 RepID=UPI001F16E243|nr:hypothetical protein [Nereida sp. MMG025]MCF6445030.1 hypothetical protein [Nereida sp. MMG025]
MPPVLRTDPAARSALSWRILWHAALRSWTIPSFFGFAILLATVGASAVTSLEDSPRFGGAFTLVGTVAYVLAFGIFVVWLPLGVAVFAARLAALWGVAGWGYAVVLGAGFGLAAALWMDQGNLGTNAFGWIILPILGAGYGGFFWRECYRTAPRAFAPPPK